MTNYDMGGMKDMAFNVVLLQIINKQRGEGMMKPLPSRSKTIGTH